VDVTVTNTVGWPATLYGWIDYNGDGVFDNVAERASATVPDGTIDGTVTLTFPAVPAGSTSDSFARFRLSTDFAAANPTGAASDGEVEDYAVQMGWGTDLGTVDFRELPARDPSSGEVRYGLQTKRAGFLTIMATYDAAGGAAALELLDANGQSLASSAVGGGHERIDWPAALPGSEFRIRLTGSNSDVDLALCNLVNHVGQTVTVHGTGDADEFEYVPAASHRVTIKGVEYDVEEGEVRRVEFIGGAGDDSAKVVGTSGPDTAQLFPAGNTDGHQLVFHGSSGVTVNVKGTKDLQVAGRGGANTATFADTSGKDILVARPNSVTLFDGDFWYDHSIKEFQRSDNYQYMCSVKSFGHVTITSDGGSAGDEAVLIGSRDTETFKASLDEAVFFQGTHIGSAPYVVTAQDFPAVYAWPKGGYDEAYFEDSPRTDAYKATWIYGLMQYTRENGTRLKRRATRFDKYTVDSIFGGGDTARLYASNYNDRLNAKPSETVWQQAYRRQSGQAKYEHILTGFRTVMPRAWDTDSYSPDTDHDTARLWTNPGDTYEELGPGEAQIHDARETYNVWLKGFDEITHEGSVPRTPGASGLLSSETAKGISDSELAALAYVQSHKNNDDEGNEQATAIVMATDAWLG
jgi:hypothetical protein